MRKEKIQAQVENLFYILKLLFLPIVIIMTIALIISSINSLITIGTTDALKTLKEGIYAIMFTQSIFFALASGMTILSAVVCILKDMTSFSDNVAFDLVNKFERVNGVALKGESIKGLKIILLIPMLMIYVAILAIPFVAYFFSSKFVVCVIIDTITKFLQLGYKCPKCRKNMLWKKEFPYNIEGNKETPQIVDYYFYCPKCCKYYTERLVVVNGKHESSFEKQDNKNI